ncbi:uncharacterized protein N7458_011359 [Penicillium daleae]|uniref:Uncharacterized protein n=1 Tax=Penicillium daleae TaxID=63821 RepID=A0AAD6BSZ0_9EURO|nr:uncharacterized protein N7458_011359 [Penicillium daleae]KAJ5432203.1 hypothetical protein N7458_011359 [Penicillium daleae]
MASISKFNTAFLSMPNELTVAAANFNIDFSLMKVEAPKEFHGVRDALSKSRRHAAEEGQPHVTARRLGALFEAIVPPIPHLIQAYGNRVSAISSRTTTKSQKFPTSEIFAAHAGPDATSIWAAATSGRGALAVHLLACMLARIWKGPEAISLWVELVERRKEEIHNNYNNYNATETAAIMAAQQIFGREQLAAWDLSARSWLQTADSDRNLQQTQLMLIVNNVKMPVNTKEDPYQSVLEAWTLAMRAMELRCKECPNEYKTVLVDESKSVDLHDELLNGSVITISAHGADGSREGVFWSLPLGRMRYYSPPVIAERRLASDTSRISMDEFWMVILGIFVSQWKAVCPGPEKCCKIIQLLADRVDLSAPSLAWLKFLTAAARRYTDARDVQQRQFAKLLGLGMRWCTSFLNDLDHQPPPLFGLGNFLVS